ncbi:MAG: hypothetical protein BMS9Abin02_2129 [Anaerolineae bacterium]|nr:MAG: hypothetical protein BMS9Abin02_2129 [Anaerolineae bacterium]
MSKAWKHFERRVAKFFGGKRIPINGRGDTEDVDHPWMAIECKYRKALPTYMTSGMAQAVANAEDGQLPVVIAGQKGRDVADSFVVVRARDFREWFGKTGG